MGRRSGGGEPRVVHVLPQDTFRGAQRYARDLIDRAQAQGWDHTALTIYRAAPAALRPEHCLDLDRPRQRVARTLDLRVVRPLRRAVDRLAPDVVVAHGSEPLKYVRIAGIDVPLVQLRIGTSHPKLDRQPIKSFHRWLTADVSAFVAVGRDVLTDIERAGVPDGAFAQLIPNGRDPGLYHPPDGPRRRPPGLLYVGHLTATKRPLRFVEVARQVIESGRSVRATIVGDGPQRAEVERAAAPLGIDVVGARDDTAALMREHDVFVFPSSPVNEGLPGVLIEAAMSGLAIVTTKVPGADEVVAHGRSGLVVDVDDAPALAAAAAQLIDDGRLRRELGDAARADALERFDLDATLDLWAGVLSQVATNASNTNRQGAAC